MGKKRIILAIFLNCLLSLSVFALPVKAKDAGNKATDRYIVVFKDSVQESEQPRIMEEFGKKYSVSGTELFEQVMKGFSTALSQSQLEKIKKDPRVEFVSEDREVHMLGSFEAEGKPSGISAAAVQTIPTGVRRINAPVTSTSTAVNTGQGVVVAVIDTGIDTTHPDLKANILNSGKSCIVGTTAKDDNGHGSHVAGTIAAANNTAGVVGVAPGAKLIPVKVLNRNGSGSWSSVICGIDWVTANAARYNIKVASMSLGGLGTSDNNCGLSNSDALHRAICRARDAGVTFVVAAGNESDNANNHVPAAYTDAVITVSALADSNGAAGGTGAATPYGADDTFATFSNYGSAVALAAPGVNIYSTYKNGGYATMSGTSMATPHVSGAAALYIYSHPGSNWVQVRDALKASGEALGFGHADPSQLHPEPVLQAGTF